jgi:hypothetical protein
MSVTITGRGLTPNAFVFDLVQFLAEQKLSAHSVVTTPLSATVVVANIGAGTNAEANKPATFKATLRVDGAVTFPSA